MAEFLTIYTPTYKRPALLDRCVQSVKAQTARASIQHLIVKDEEGRGIPAMFAAIPDHVKEIRGQYVYILQDDDILAGREVVALLHLYTRWAGDPAVIMVKVRKRGQILPTYWGERPRVAHVDLGNYAVRADVFAQHAADFGRRYEGDFDFIDSLWRAGHGFGWCDLLFAHALAIGTGRPETEIEEAITEPPERAVSVRMR